MWASRVEEYTVQGSGLGTAEHQGAKKGGEFRISGLRGHFKVFGFTRVVKQGIVCPYRNQAAKVAARLLDPAAS